MAHTLDAIGYYLTAPNKPLEKRDFSIELDSLNENDVVVSVAGCGLCHTDIGFLSGAVATKAPLPLILGHEISGTVVHAAGPYADMGGKKVIIPAVLPCGECALCKKGRSNACRKQKMPGNDFNGGFASHIVVPGRFLCILPDELGPYSLAELSVVADAVTTPYQSLVRSKLASGDLAIVVGVGGIGNYMAQWALSRGAIVIALDIDEAKLETVKKLGIHHTVNVAGLSEREVKKQIRHLVKEHSLPGLGWKVFETSGTAAGQKMAFSLLNFTGTMGVVGFTMDKVEIRLSNAMAFDADIFGNWGCRAEYYPEVVESVLNGEINVKDNVEMFPLDQLNECIERAQNHTLEKRAVLMP